jgi:threonine aldolase
MIDLRSDTVTLPTQAMREAMFTAEVGDDVYGEDPTVLRLEAMAAQRLGTEAGLFVVSGTMANLVALLTHCGRGDEVIFGTKSHTFLFEAGASAALGGIHHYAVPNQSDGTLRLEDIEGSIRAENVHHPRTRLVCLENTHNRCGGKALSAEYTQAVCDLAHHHDLAVHIDGARIFNAAVSLQVDVRDLVADADSVGFCLSKGLSAPVGSVLCGSEGFVQEARRWRKAVGGGMRQCGVIAAAGIVALEEMVDRLAEDHDNARRLANGIAALPGIEIDPAEIETDIVIFGVDAERMPAAALVDALLQKGVQVSAVGPTSIRAVTHYGIAAHDIDATVDAIREVMEAA